MRAATGSKSRRLVSGIRARSSGTRLRAGRTSCSRPPRRRAGPTRFRGRPVDPVGLARAALQAQGLVGALVQHVVPPPDPQQESTLRLSRRIAPQRRLRLPAPVSRPPRGPLRPLPRAGRRSSSKSTPARWTSRSPATRTCAAPTSGGRARRLRLGPRRHRPRPAGPDPLPSGLRRPLPGLRRVAQRRRPGGAPPSGRRRPPLGEAARAAVGRSPATIPRLMAVPKKRTSRARRDKRRANHKARRRASTSARAATARGSRTGSARPAAPTPGARSSRHEIAEPRSAPPARTSS